MSVLTRPMGNVIDQTGASIHERGGRASALHGGEPGKPAGHVAAIQLADPLLWDRQPRYRRRHGDRRLCRGAGGDLRHVVDRPADRIHILPRPALCADQPNYAELGADRRCQDRSSQDFRDSRHRAGSQGRYAKLSSERSARGSRLVRGRLSLSRRHPNSHRHRAESTSRDQDCCCRPDRSGQIDASRSVAPVLRSVGGLRRHRWGRCS